MKNLVKEVINDFKVFNNFQKVVFCTMVICTMAVMLCGLSLIVGMLFNGMTGNNIPFL